MSIRTEMAERLGLRTLSDFARVSGDMRAGFTADFIGLPDGLPGLRRAYGLAPKTVSALAPAVKYQALAQGAVDIIDAYSTDGLLDRISPDRARGRPPVLPALRRRRHGARRLWPGGGPTRWRHCRS